MIIREKVRIGDQTVTLETGRIAKQAGGSCLVRAGDTIVLVTACGNQEPKPGQGFFPLSVDYQEKTYAAGKIPGGFFKREGKLRDYEVLTSRLIDRPCRPLFPEGYLSEVQIIATVMSFDQQNPPDVLAMVGASAALHMSQMPWNGPIAGVRVGRVDGEFVANPTYAQMAESDCELLVAASRDAIVMVEGEADEITEEDMVEALLFAHASVQDTLDLIERMRQAVGKPKWTFAGDTTPSILRERLRTVAHFKVREACSIANKGARGDAFKQIRREALEILGPEFPGQDEAIKGAFEDLRYNTMRSQVLEEGRRLDGRDTRTVRPISIELGVLPRVHGSSLFTRGETQAIVTSTLGTARDAQRLDTLQGDQHKRFMLHYNFPPYSVGECKPMRGPGRREVGHGDLAERALAKMLPSQEEFPYTIRIVSEITESNGSSSMASVCGGALALMDAGVPIKSPVAGVAMGLIKEGEHYAVLTDILGDEDALGDMDFKVCGTEKGVTAIQMDIKIEGLSREILERALTQAREARLHILDKMQRSITAPREELSQYAPRITQIRVKPDQVRTIIGPGGKMIRAIVDQTGASIDVEDDGTVSVSSADSAAVAKALEIIKSLTTEPEIGDIYEGVVKRIEPYGAFLEILPGKDGLCHISDIDWSHVTSVEDYMKLGDKVPVKLTNIDREGRIRLSRKDAMPEPAGGTPLAKLNGRAAEDRPVREERAFERTRDEAPAPRAEREPWQPRARELDREERPAARARDLDRPARARDLDREERPAARSRDLDREERVAKPRELDREERRPRARDELRDEDGVIAKPRELDREERRPRARDELREDRPARARELDRALPRDEVLEEKPRALDREGRGSAKPRDFDREPPLVEKPRTLDREAARKRRDFDREPPLVEKPRPLEREGRGSVKPRDFDREERVAKPRELDREERALPKARDFDREERPLPKARDFDREERPLPKARDFDREERPLPKARGLEREERVAAKARDFDREERPLPKARDFDREERPLPKARDFDREERPLPKTRGLEREERVVAKPRDLERGGRARDEELRRERATLTPDERDDRPRSLENVARDDGRELGGRGRRDIDVAKPLDDRKEPFAKARGDIDEERPRTRSARGRDLEERVGGKARELDRDEPRGARAVREVERELPARASRREPTRELELGARSTRRDIDERTPVREEGFEAARPARRELEGRPARLRGRDDERLRDEPSRPRRELDVDERPPARARGRDDRDDERFEPRASERPDSDRPARARGIDAPPPARAPKRAERAAPVDEPVDEERFEAGAPALARNREERTERDRPSRVRARARNRERVRELEREREPE